MHNIFFYYEDACKFVWLDVKNFSSSDKRKFLFSVFVGQNIKLFFFSLPSDKTFLFPSLTSSETFLISTGTSRTKNIFITDYWLLRNKISTFVRFSLLFHNFYTTFLYLLWLIQGCRKVFICAFYLDVLWYIKNMK